MGIPFELVLCSLCTVTVMLSYYGLCDSKFYKLLYVIDLAHKTRTLAMESKVYVKEAKFLNLRTSLAATAAIVVMFVLILIFLRFWLF